MDKVADNVFFVQRRANRELDARNHVCLRFAHRPRTGGRFLDFHVAPHAAIYRSVRNSSNGVDHLTGVRVRFSAENATGGNWIGLPDSSFRLLVC